MHELRQRQRQARLLHLFRKAHRATGAALFLFFMAVAVTGLLLGWKKHSGTLLLPPSRQGTTTDLSRWLPLDSLEKSAAVILRDSLGPHLSTEIDRIDVRPEKGMVKFVYARHFWGLQIDGATGRLLQIERRRSDIIEHLHDGSMADRYLGTGGYIKLLYTSVLGLALLVFTVTGFWLWYGPRRMRGRMRHD